MNLAKIFSFESYEFTPKYAYSTIKDFTNKHKNQNSFDKLKDSMLSLEHIKQDSYVLQIDSGNWDRSVESYFFSIYSDKSGYYLRTDDNKIKHFHNKENALKYNLAKIMVNKYSCEKIRYFCYEFNEMDESLESYDYINYAYDYGRRIII